MHPLHCDDNDESTSGTHDSRQAAQTTADTCCCSQSTTHNRRDLNKNNTKERNEETEQKKKKKKKTCSCHLPRHYNNSNWHRVFWHSGGAQQQLDRHTERREKKNLIKISRNSANLSLSLSLSLCAEEQGRRQRKTRSPENTSLFLFTFEAPPYTILVQIHPRICTHPGYLYTNIQNKKYLAHIYTYLYVQYKYIRIYVILGLFSFTYLLACLFRSFSLFIYLF
jgi:hypothetical protein